VCVTRLGDPLGLLSSLTLRVWVLHFVQICRGSTSEWRSHLLNARDAIRLLSGGGPSRLSDPSRSLKLLIRDYAYHAILVSSRAYIHACEILNPPTPPR
jgi:hypothetical protein